jgi:CheY-like chemotaxis protein
MDKIGFGKKEELSEIVEGCCRQFPLPLYGTDPDGIILFWNKGMAVFSGVDPKKAVGRNISDISSSVFGGGNGFILAGLSKGKVYFSGNAVRHDETIISDTSFIRGSAKFLARLFSSSIRSGGGKAVLFIEGISSLSSSQKLPSELCHLFPVKGAEKAMRTELLSRFELIQRLVSTLAHQYNNIIGVILQNIESLKEQEPSFRERQKKQLGVILMEAERGARLGKSLLGLEGIFGEDKAFDINEIIVSLEEIIRAFLGRGKNVTFALSDQIPYINLREGIVEDFLFAVASFCSSISTEDSKMLIETGRMKKKKPAAEDTVSITIRISDISISPLDLVRAFRNPDYFFNYFKSLAVLRETLTRDGNGFDIKAEKKGISFHLALTGTGKSTTLDKWHGDDLPTGRGTILLVEDESALRDVMRMTLERLGYTVQSAEDLKSARNILSRLENKIDLLLTDILLPDGNGLELYRKAAEGASIPTLLISGYSNVSLPSPEEMKEKKVAFLAKPFTRADLAKKVKSLIER